MEEANKTCKITLYLDTPKPLLRPFKDPTKHSQLASFFINHCPDIAAITGHAFVGLTNEKGVEERWGYSGSTLSPFKAINGTKGVFDLHEPECPYNEAIIWNISPEQFNAAQNTVNALKENPGTYKLFKNNCATTALSILKAANVEDLPSDKLGLTPYGLVLKKRWMLAKRRLEVARFKTKNLLNSLFGKEKVPSNDLLDSLRSKPLPVPINNGMKAFRQNRAKSETKPIDVAKVLASVSNIRS